MDPYTPGDRRGDRRSSLRRPVTTPYRSSRRSRSRAPLVIAGTVIVALVAVAGYFGVRWVTHAASGAGSSQSSAASSATASGFKRCGISGCFGRHDDRLGGSTGSSSASGTAQSSASGPAWRTADPSWMKKYLGLEIDGFKTEPGYKGCGR